MGRNGADQWPANVLSRSCRNRTRNERKAGRRGQEPGRGLGPAGASEPLERQGRPLADQVEMGGHAVGLGSARAGRAGTALNGWHQSAHDDTQPERRQQPKREASPTPMDQQQVRTGRPNQRRALFLKEERRHQPCRRRSSPAIQRRRHPERSRQRRQHDRVKLGQRDPRHGRHGVVSRQQRQRDRLARSIPSPQVQRQSGRGQEELLEHQQDSGLRREAIQWRQDGQDRSDVLGEMNGVVGQQSGAERAPVARVPEHLRVDAHVSSAGVKRDVLCDGQP